MKADSEGSEAPTVPGPGGAYPGRTVSEMALLPKLYIKAFPQN